MKRNRIYIFLFLSISFLFSLHIFPQTVKKDKSPNQIGISLGLNYLISQNSEKENLSTISLGFLYDHRLSKSLVLSLEVFYISKAEFEIYEGGIFLKHPISKSWGFIGIGPLLGKQKFTSNDNESRIYGIRGIITGESIIVSKNFNLTGYIFSDFLKIDNDLYFSIGYKIAFTYVLKRFEE